MSPSPLPEPGSIPRAIAGIVSLVVALVVLAGGFVLLVSVLEDGGYNSRAMIEAFAVLGLGGGLLALGIGLVIWEMSVRYGIRR